MASAAKWIDELGIPPQAVCLDWAWQIQRQQLSLERQPSALPLSWEDVDVVEEGQVILIAATEARSADSLMQQLLQWATPAAAEKENTAIIVDVSHLEPKLLLQELRRATEQFCKLELVDRSRLEIQDQADEATDHVSYIPNKDTQKLNSKSSTGWRLALFALQHYVAASLMASAFLMALGGFMFYSHKAIPKPLLTAQKSVAPVDDLTKSTSNISQKSASSRYSKDSDASLTEQLVEIPSLAADLRIQPQNEIALPNASTTALSAISKTQLDDSAIAVAEPAPMSSPLAAESDIRKEMPEVLSNEHAELDKAGERDVMSEVADVAKAAESKQSETELSVLPDAAAASESENEPLWVATFPMLQTQKIPARRLQRVKQPAWLLQLSVDKEFELSPAGPQSLTDRQTITWFLSNADSSPPRTRIMIQVQAVGGTQPALRWRIGAGAEDMPQLSLPLEREFLNTAQQRLRKYSQWARFESERLKQGASDAAREVRTALVKQGKFLDGESKLASRLSAVVAESQLMDDLLHRQFTVYAQLRDGKAADAPVLLQFGDLESLNNATDSTQDDLQTPPKAKSPATTDQ